MGTKLKIGILIVLLFVLDSLLGSLLYDPTRGSATAYANEGWNFVGMLGPGSELSLPEEPVVFVWGASLAYTFKDRWEVGGEFEMTGSVPTIGADVNYYIEEPFFVGLQAGADLNTKITSYIGPQIGFDYKLDRRMTLGAEFQYLETINDRGGIVEMLATFKYYFE